MVAYFWRNKPMPLVGAGELQIWNSGIPSGQIQKLKRAKCEEAQGLSNPVSQIIFGEAQCEK